MILQDIPSSFLQVVELLIRGTCSRSSNDCLGIAMSGYDSNNPGGSHASNSDTVRRTAQASGSIPASTGESTRQRALGHRRQKSELIGYKYPPANLEPSSNLSSEQPPQRTPEQSIRQQILRIAGNDDGPYPRFARPGTRPNLQTQNNNHSQDHHHSNHSNNPNDPNRAGSDDNVNPPAIELPRAVSPISSFRLLGITGRVTPSEDSEEAPLPQDADTRTSSPVNYSTMPRRRAGSEEYRADNEFFHVFECFSFIVTVDKVNFVLYIFMIILLISIAVSSTAWNKSELEESKKLWILGWLGGSVFALILLLACYQTRDADLKECGYPTGYDKNRDWIALGDMDDIANQRARFQDTDQDAAQDHPARACVPPPLIEDISPYPNPMNTWDDPDLEPYRWSVFSKQRILSNAKKRREAFGGDDDAAAAAGASGTSIPLQNLAPRDPAHEEEELAKAMEDRIRVAKEWEAKYMGRSTALADHSERQFGEGLPHVRWSREPRGSMSNLRGDHYDNGAPGPATGSSRTTSSVATRFNELTPITERSGEALSPRSTRLSSPQEAAKSPSRSDETTPSSPPSAPALHDSV